MRLTILVSLVVFVACNTNKEKNTSPHTDTLETTPDTMEIIKEDQTDTGSPTTSYANKRFKDVRVERIGMDSFRVRGQGQIFEANFGWVVEDGHYELKKGFQMTDAGAPDWGKFDFIIQVQKNREHSTLTLVLFESSPEDGSRQHELPITLY